MTTRQPDKVIREPLSVNQLTVNHDVRDIELRNKVEGYKLELTNLIESGMFYTAKKTLNKCIKEVSDYRSELYNR